MLNILKKEAALGHTENGGITNISSGSHCLDLFFRAGAMRNVSESDIANAVIKAYTESPEKTMKIIFFARDARGGLGERRFFRAAVKTLADNYPEAVKRNISNFAEYGRFDDLTVLLGTSCEKEAAAEISAQLERDKSAMAQGGKVSLLAKWLPSANASSAKTRADGRRLARLLGLSEPEYRKTLSALRKYSDILENRLRVMDYTFDYEHQPSRAMFKYRKAFIRNDGERYKEFIGNVKSGKAKLNAGALYPYDVVRSCRQAADESERAALDAGWQSLTDCGNGSENVNAIAVVDGSGSMYWGQNLLPIDAAMSLGIYFAEHNKGIFGGHFITFSEHPQLVEIKGSDIYSKVKYCMTFSEVANTNVEAVFELILSTAVKHRAKPGELPGRIYIISDMEFDCCVEGGNSLTVFDAMKKKYARHGYKLPDVIFWNVSSRRNNLPVTLSDTGAALVSGASPAVFDMVLGGDVSPEKVMNDILYSERYARVS